MVAYGPQIEVHRCAWHGNRLRWRLAGMALDVEISCHQMCELLCRLRAPSVDCTFSVARGQTPSDLWHPSFVQTTEPAEGSEYEDLRAGEN